MVLTSLCSSPRLKQHTDYRRCSLSQKSIAERKKKKNLTVAHADWSAIGDGEIRPISVRRVVLKTHEGKEEDGSCIRHFRCTRMC